MSDLARRIARLEAQRLPRRPCLVWSEGPHDDGSAEIARRIAEGTAHLDDDFIIIRWLAPGEHGEVAGLRRAKNDLERD